MFKIILVIALLNIFFFIWTHIKFKKIKKEFPSKDPSTILPVRRFLFAIIFIGTTIYIVLSLGGQLDKNVNKLFNKVESKQAIENKNKMNTDESKDYILYVKNKCEQLSDTLEKNECYRQESKTVTTDKDDFLKEMSKAINK